MLADGLDTPALRHLDAIQAQNRGVPAGPRADDHKIEMYDAGALYGATTEEDA
jgi:hypothetical protein